MKPERRLALALLILATMTLACSLPSFLRPAAEQSREAAMTAVAQTVEAELAAAETLEPTAPPSATPAPTDSGPTPTTAPPTATFTPTLKPPPCDRAGFVKDVTVPDGSDFAPGEAFTKTWRLKNTGTCTWTSGYQLIFDSGDQMGGASPTQLTSGAVEPGQEVDVSVDLVAPAAPGTYIGYWKLRNPSGVVFGLGDDNAPFYVEIEVLAPTSTPTPTPTPAPAETTVHLSVVTGESGSVRSNGQVLGVENVGDTASNHGSQAFLSFDISGIPAGATITKVVVDFTNYDTLDDPFGDLGCLRLYPHDYGTLDSSDYFSGTALGAIVRWCSEGELSSPGPEAEVKAALQAKLGSSRFQLRAQFNEVTTDSDGMDDMVRFGSAIKLIVTYTAP